MDIKSETTSKGKTRYVVTLDNGEEFACYENGSSVVIRQSQEYYCSIKSTDFKRIFENVNLLACNGGDYHGYLKRFHKKGKQSIKSEDGLFSFGYSMGKDGRAYVYAHKYAENRQRTIYSDIGSEEDAKKCIEETCREYNETGKFKVYRTNNGGDAFPEEYSSETVTPHVEEAQISEKLEEYFINRVTDLEAQVKLKDELLALKDIEIENLKASYIDDIANEIGKRLKCPICGDKRIVMTSRKGEPFLGCCSGEMHRTDDYDDLAILLHDLGFLESWETYHGLTSDGKIPVRS